MHSVNTRAKIRFMRFLLEVSVKLLVIFTSDNYDLMVTLFSWIWFASNWGHTYDVELEGILYDGLSCRGRKADS